jgi:hypothetical protein
MKTTLLVLFATVMLSSCVYQKTKHVSVNTVNYAISHYDYFNLVKTPIENKKAINYSYSISITENNNEFKACYSKSIIDCLKSLHNLQSKEIACKSEPLCISFIKNENNSLQITDNSEVITEFHYIENNCRFPSDSISIQGINDMKWLGKNNDRLNYELSRDLELIYSNILDTLEVGKTTIKFPYLNDDEIEIQDSIEFDIIQRAKELKSFQVTQTKVNNDNSKQVRMLEAIDVFSFSQIERPNHDELITKYLNMTLDILDQKGITLNSTERFNDYDGKLKHLIKITNTESGTIIKKVKTEMQRQ